MNAEIGEDGALRVGLVMSFDGEEKQWSCERRHIGRFELVVFAPLGRSPNRIDCSSGSSAKIRLVVQNLNKNIDFVDFV
ncbi:hypothetical protein Syun_014507 [Stephania yunnanensis]|uniref:Uncharacterized protein n=1 Tax=Stephania yunnanensis TaxID=152371 RepID=A0AAP0JJN5_9MAGN